jgi:hypothetical protein
LRSQTIFRSIMLDCPNSGTAPFLKLLNPVHF